MVLVVGATGLLGGTVCAELAARGVDLAALVRAGSDDVKRQRIADLGAEAVEGDLTDRDSLMRACDGQDVVISTASATQSMRPTDSIDAVDLDGQLALIDAAKAGGARQMVYVSFSKNMTTPSPLNDAKRTVEKALIASGLDYTILRSSFFMQMLLTPIAGFDPANGSITVYGDGTHPISFVSVPDVGRAVAAAVGNDAVRSAVIEYGGPEARTPLDIVSSAEKLTGAPIAVQYMPEAAIQAQIDSDAPPVPRSFAGLMMDFAHGDVVDSQLPAGIPAASETVEQHITALLSQAP